MDPPGDAKPDQEIIARIFLKVRELYQKEGGKFPIRSSRLNWWYSGPDRARARRSVREINGWAVTDVKDGQERSSLKAGAQLGKFLDTRADGSTLSGNWLYIGMYHARPAICTQRRDPADPSGLGRYPEWAFSWPANRRIMYNRCSADGDGKPWDSERSVIAWNGEKWVGDVPDYKPDSPPEAGMGAVHHARRRRGAPLRARPVRRRPVARALRAGGIARPNPLHPDDSSNPAVKLFKTPYDRLGEAKDYPIVCTTYRLAEHFHYWTKNNAYNMPLQPEFFVEIPEELAGRRASRTARRCASLPRAGPSKARPW